MTLSILSGRSALMLLVLAGCASCGGGGKEDDNGTQPGPLCSTTFFNPVGSGADPWVVRQGTSYYFIESRENGIWVYKTDTLTSLKKNGVKVWSAPSAAGVWNRSNVWAPELHFIDGKWYIYYAAGSAGPPFIHQRAGVLESSGTDPQGPYTDRGMLYTGDDFAAGGSAPTAANTKWAIDLTVHRLGGQLYAVWSGWEQNAATDATPQHLYIAPMSNPYTISGNRVKISSPVESWETGGPLNLQEGPTFLTNGTNTFIVYSTRESWTRDYRLGLLRLTSPTADPMNPASWAKSAGPVFMGANDAYGVGHASFTTSPDGTEQWIVYHSKSVATNGWDDRKIRMQKFTWNADGTPNFGTPAPSTQLQAAPAGQCTT